MTEIEKFEMIEAMRKYGGSFVRALSDCFMKADHNNFDKLQWEREANEKVNRPPRY